MYNIPQMIGHFLLFPHIKGIFFIIDLMNSTLEKDLNENTLFVCVSSELYLLPAIWQAGLTH